MDIEERKRRLAEAKAAREAKARQIEKLSTSLDAAHSVPKTENVLPEKKPESITEELTFVKGVAGVSIAPQRPPKVEVYTKSSDTDHVFIYSEERPHPDSVVLKENNVVEVINNDNGHIVESLGTLGYTMMPGMIWDNTGATGRILRSSQFLDFIDRATVAIGSNIETGGCTPIFAPTETAKQKVRGLTCRGSYKVDNLSRNGTVVVAIAFQSGSSDNFSVAFGSGEVPGSTREGHLHDAVFMWNTRRGTPLAFQFHFEIHCLTYSLYHPYLLFGGSARGHIVMWDVRSGPQAISVSFPSLGHTCPVVFLKMVGDANRNALVSLSRDGRLCMWSPDAVKHPLSSAVISSNRERVAITAASAHFCSAADLDVGKVIFGLTRGSLHTVSRNITARQLESSQIGGGVHPGSVTGVDCHSLHSDPSVSNLVLTCGSEWCCRMWLGDVSIKIEGFTDCVYDVKWCPTNAALFAAADASGCITLWNVTQSIQAPQARIHLEDSTSLTGRGPLSIHKICWDDSGEHIIAGGNQGETFFIAVHHESVCDNEVLKMWVYRNFRLAS